MSTTNTVQNIHARVDALLPEIAGRGHDIENGRRVPADIVAKLRDAGCFRMAVPHELGGAECNQTELFELYEDIATADASAAWVVMIGSPTPSYLQRFAEDTIRAVYANGPDVILGVALAPTGRATPVEGGYRVSGRWSWCSGAPGADLFMCNCVVGDAELVAGGPFPDMRFVLLEPGKVALVDNWRVSGLKGTGSGDITVSDTFVPTERAAGFFDAPSPILKHASNVGAAASAYVTSVALGIARGALCDLHGLTKANKRRLGSPTRLAEEGLFQYRLGEAETALRATRAAFYAQVQAWELFARNAPADTVLAMHPMLHATNATSVWALKQAVAIVDMAYAAGGGSSVWDGCALQRRFRDIHTATQHISVQDAVLTRHGAMLAA